MADVTFEVSLTVDDEVPVPNENDIELWIRNGAEESAELEIEGLNVERL